MSLIASICVHRYSPGNDNYALACSIVMGRTLHNTNSPSSLSYTDTMASTHWRQKSMPDGWVHRYKLCRLNFINIYFLKTWCVLHSNIDNIFYVSSGLITTASPPFHLCAMWQVRAPMGSKYRRAQVLDGHDLGRVIPLADQGTNPAQVGRTPTSVLVNQKTCFALWALNFPYVLDTVISKVVIPRLQPSEQSSHVSPNKSTKVSDSQHHHM